MEYLNIDWGKGFIQADLFITELLLDFVQNPEDGLKFHFFFKDPTVLP